MQRHQRVFSALAATLVWLGPVNAAPLPDSWPDPDDVAADTASEATSVPAVSSWLLVEARNHASGSSSLAAVVLGVAQERGQSRPARLRVDCFDRVTTVHLDTVGLGLGMSAVAVRYSLDGGRYVSASWQASVDGNGLELSADRAVDFLNELHGKAELRLAVVRPLSVPFVFRFAVNGADQPLRAMAQGCHWSGGPAVSDAGP